MSLPLPRLSILIAAALALACARARAADAPYINTWLVAGPFPNDAANGGFDRDLVGETTAAPKAGAAAGDKVWRYFDDRLFSRNYDDYQDLFSYFRVVRNDGGGPQAAYAFVYAYSAEARPAELRVGADSELEAWLNGARIASSLDSGPERDKVRAAVRLRAGWNRLLLKVANRADGRLGFYARLCGTDGAALSGLTYSTGGPAAALAVDTRAMAETPGRSLPTAYLEWPYVALDALAHPDPNVAVYLAKHPASAAHASAFALTAEGGAPPYRWSLADGALPSGLSLNARGTITGTVAASAETRAYPLTVRVTDGAGSSATAALSLTVRERPNRWYEAARLVGLIHKPEALAGLPASDLDAFARLMKRQGYGLGMVIAYNNADDGVYRLPSRFDPNPPYGDLAGRYRKALGAQGVRFGMYFGSLTSARNGGADGALVMMAEAMKRYRPAAIWLDWAGEELAPFPSLDALYSVVKTIVPDCVIVLNGVRTLYLGDWDALCLEGWGAWGSKIATLPPFHVRWPKAIPVESWRLLPDPAFEYTRGLTPDWQAYLRLQIALIGQGFVADIDHSPTLASPMKTLLDSPLLRAHRDMADWASPDGLPARYPSYTDVDPGPLAETPWGYDTVSLARDTLYLHLMRDPFGKTGMPASGSLTVEPVEQPVRSARWLNRDRAVTFTQQGLRVTLSLEGMTADPVDTIIELKLSGPLARSVERAMAEGPANLALGKPSALLSADGSRTLPASADNFAPYGVDGLPGTRAQAANEYAWTYQVDLEEVQPLRRIVVIFAQDAYATEYNLLASRDGRTWTAVARNARGGPGRHEHVFSTMRARYVRVQAVLPNGPNQEGGQMGVSELEAYR